MTVPSLTPSTLLAAASENLQGGGYERVENPAVAFDSGRLFEDARGVALVVVYETYSELMDGWPEAQDHLVTTMSRYWERGEPKTWDGYLVLLTSEDALDRYSEVDRLRYDTTRVRKLVGCGEDLRTLGDIERLLSPLLPLQVEHERSDRADVLDALPSLLRTSVPPEVLNTILAAFRQGEPLLDAIHKHLNPDDDQ